MSTSAREERAVHCKIEREDDRSEHQLHATRKATRVEDRQQVVLDEAAAVARFPSAHPESVLERRERTHPPRKLDHHSPHRGRKVQPGQPRTSENDKSAENDERDERDVDDDDEISERAVPNGSARPDLWAARRQSHLGDERIEARVPAQGIHDGVHV